MLQHCHLSERIFLYFVFVLHYFRGPEKKGGKDEIGTLMQEHSKALKGFTYAWQPIAAADLFHLERVKSLRHFYCCQQRFNMDLDWIIWSSCCVEFVVY